MADLNSNVSVSTSIASAGVSEAGFGIPIWISPEPTFSGRTSSYLSAAEAAADALLDADSIAAVAAAFAQSPCVTEVKVGRLDTPSNQVDTITIGGATPTGDKFKITIGAVDYEVTVGADETPAAVAVLLRAALAADPLMDVTTPGTGAIVVLTAKVEGVAITVAVSKTSVGGTIVDVQTAASSIAVGLSAILAADDDWFGFSIYSQTKAQILLAAAWAETNKRFFVAQSPDADILTSGTSDVASALKALTYAWTALLFNDGTNEYAAMALLGKKLSANPDNVSTIWKYATLAGIAASTMTTSEKGYALAKFANVYLLFKGIGAVGDGKRANGQPIDILITQAWTEARIAERAAALLILMTNTNRKVPYTDEGITQFASIVEGVMADGVSAGHFTAGSTLVTAPRASDVTAGAKTARTLAISWIVELSGAIEGVTYTGILSVDL